MLSRGAICSVALLAVLTASNAAAQPAPDPNIVVTGEREPPTDRQITEQARNISIIGDPLDNPLPRFEDWVCPGVLGLKEDAAAYIIERLRYNAEQFGLRLAKDDGSCEPNLIVAFVEDPQNQLVQLAKSQGYMLAGLAVAGDVGDSALQAISSYLVIYAAMNLGVFAVIIAVARKTRSGDIASYGGLFEYAPGLAVSMAVFLFSLAGIPPLAGWYAKFAIFSVTVEADNWIGYSLAVAIAINSVIALFYYANIARQMFMNPAPDGDTTRIRVPFSLVAALAITVVATVGLGVFPRAVTQITEVSLLAVGG